MAKKVTAESFLKNMTGPVEDDAPAVAPERLVTTSRKAGSPSKAKQTLKHFGGYLEPEVFEKIALLRARLSLDNSDLMTKAIEELYSREVTARKFGDR